MIYTDISHLCVIRRSQAFREVQELELYGGDPEPTLRLLLLQLRMHLQTLPPFLSLRIVRSPDEALFEETPWTIYATPVDYFAGSIKKLRRRLHQDPARTTTLYTLHQYGGFMELTFASLLVLNDTLDPIMSRTVTDSHLILDKWKGKDQIHNAKEQSVKTKRKAEGRCIC